MNNKVYIIAEIGINHNGSIDLAKLLIDKAKNDGCDAVKFQKRTIDLVYTKEELDKFRESPWGTTTRQQKEGLEFSIDQYQELQWHTEKNEIDFIVSCWDLNSLKETEENLCVDYHKVASAMLTDKEFLMALNKTGKPIIISTGMSTDKQIDSALKILNNVEYILACTSTYPTAYDEVNLKYMQTLKLKYPDYKIGFSNHCSSLLACQAAVALDAKMIEFHITLDRSMYGSDQAASISNSRALVEGIRNIEKMLGDGKKRVYESEKPIIKKLRKK